VSRVVRRCLGRLAPAVDGGRRGGRGLAGRLAGWLAEQSGAEQQIQAARRPASRPPPPPATLIFCKMNSLRRVAVPVDHPLTFIESSSHTITPISPCIGWWSVVSLRPGWQLPHCPPSPFSPRGLRDPCARCTASSTSCRANLIQLILSDCTCLPIARSCSSLR
jgi:hypothetical protein